MDARSVAAVDAPERLASYVGQVGTPAGARGQRAAAERKVEMNSAKDALGAARKVARANKGDESAKAEERAAEAAADQAKVEYARARDEVKRAKAVLSSLRKQFGETRKRAKREGRERSGDGEMGDGDLRAVQVIALTGCAGAVICPRET